jgi:protein-S-isoprenylcysteine O-methyltransferase Ste14
MTRSNRDRAHVTVPPPLWFLICVGAGWVLGHFAPWALPGRDGVMRVGGGVAILVVSGLFVATSFVALARHQTPFDSGSTTVAIVTDGPFRPSRNPMYLSLLLLQLAIALLLDSVWMLILVVGLFIVLDITAVRPEERHLEEKSGDAYRDYEARVRRWLGAVRGAIATSFISGR